MKTPEKIYLLSTPYIMLDGWYRDKLPIPTSFEQVEYTRTDAFIKKTVDWLEDNAIEYWGTEAVDNGMMIEDFKKAMKL